MRVERERTTSGTISATSMFVMCLHARATQRSLDAYLDWWGASGSERPLAQFILNRCPQRFCEDTPFGTFCAEASPQRFWITLVDVSRSSQQKYRQASSARELIQWDFAKTCVWHISMCAKQGAKLPRRLMAHFFMLQRMPKEHLMPQMCVGCAFRLARSARQDCAKQVFLNSYKTKGCKRPRHHPAENQPASYPRMVQRVFKHVK